MAFQTGWHQLNHASLCMQISSCSLFSLGWQHMWCVHAITMYVKSHINTWEMHKLTAQSLQVQSSFSELLHVCWSKRTCINKTTAFIILIVDWAGLRHSTCIHTEPTVLSHSRVIEYDQWISWLSLQQQQILLRILQIAYRNYQEYSTA